MTPHHNTPPLIERWHRAMAEHDGDAVDAMLHDNAVFQSPAVHKPQAGKTLVSKYLRAAMKVLNNPSFHYVDQWYGERSAVLEFACTLEGGVEVNGIDMIRWDENEQIVHFKVMVRPLKALNTVVPLMGAELQAQADAAAAGG